MLNAVPSPSTSCRCAPWPCHCSSSVLAALCQGVPLSLQLQFTSIIARRRGCKREEGIGKRGQKQPLSTCFVHVWLMFWYADAYVCMWSSVAPPLLFFLWTKALVAIGRWAMYCCSTAAGVWIIEIFDVINHEGTSVSLYRERWHWALTVCACVCVHACGWSLGSWLGRSRGVTGGNFPRTPRHNLAIFHLI